MNSKAETPDPYPFYSFVTKSNVELVMLEGLPSNLEAAYGISCDLLLPAAKAPDFTTRTHCNFGAGVSFAIREH